MPAIRRPFKVRPGPLVLIREQRSQAVFCAVSSVAMATCGVGNVVSVVTFILRGFYSTFDYSVPREKTTIFMFIISLNCTRVGQMSTLQATPPSSLLISPSYNSHAPSGQLLTPLDQLSWPCFQDSLPKASSPSAFSPLSAWSCSDPKSWKPHIPLFCPAIGCQHHYSKIILN